jgi:hypothetical protein
VLRETHASGNSRRVFGCNRHETSTTYFQKAARRPRSCQLGRCSTELRVCGLTQGVMLGTRIEWSRHQHHFWGVPRRAGNSDPLSRAQVANVV